jgi:hypothetical protein
MKRTLSLCFLLALARPAAAQAPAAKKLELRPAAAPVPALKYQLLPTIADLQPGNAVQIYYRAMLPDVFSHRREKDIDEKMTKWAKLPLRDLPREEMAWLLTYRPLLECDSAARREQCDWEMVARLKRDGLATPMSDLQSMRELGRLLQFRARLEIADGKHEQALRTLQTALAQARHVGQCPTLISGLVGVASASMAFVPLEEFIESPGAPNLYWALTALPRPFIDFHQGMQGEKVMVGTCFELPTPAALPDLLIDIIAAKENINAEQARKLIAAEVARLFPEARKALLAAGMKAEELDKLTPIRVVARQALYRYEEAMDDMAKWTYLPAYWEVRPKLQQLEKSLKERGQLLPGLSPAELVGAVGKAYSATMRTERRIAALRVVEAIRMHGKLPAKLADITLVPVPVDPWTGKEFDYRLKGDTAMLTGPAPAGEEPTATNYLQYELTMKK